VDTPVEDKVLKLSEHILSEDKNGQVLLYDEDSSIVFRTNLSGKEILDLFDGLNPTSEIVKLVRQKYSLSCEETTGVVRFIRNAFRNSILLEVGNKEINKIKMVHWDITHRCNLKCKHCYLGDVSDRELDTNNIFQIVDRLADYHVRMIEFSGGEPFVRNDMIDIVRYVADKDITVILRSNGTLIKDNVASRLSEMNNVILTVISLDGPDAKTHEFIRGENSFRSTIKGIRSLKNQNLNVGVTCTISPLNLHLLDKIAELCYRLDVDLFTASPLFIQGRALCNLSSYKLDDESLIRLHEQLIELAKKYRGSMVIPNIRDSITLWRKLGIKREGCGLTQPRLTIDPLGNVIPCRRFRDKTLFLGDIKSESLESILLKETFHFFKRLTVDKIPACKNCEGRYICGGGCRYEAFIDSGNLLGRPNDCQQLFKFYRFFVGKCQLA